MLRRQPGFTLIAVFTLALGIGATSAVFSLIHGVLLTPPPYRHPDRLVLVQSVRNDGQRDEHSPGWAPAQWMDWQSQAKSFDAVAAYGWTFNFLIQPGGSESIEGMWVAPNYFRALGLQPLLGRTFLDSEGGATAKPVVILGYDLWQRTFHGDPHQPMGHASHGDRCHASGSPVSSFATGIPGTELRSERPRGLLGSRGGESAKAEIARLERGGAGEGRRAGCPGRSGVGHSGCQTSAGGPRSGRFHTAP